MKKPAHKQRKIRNLASKNMLTSGAGVHLDKTGEHAPRNRQKRNWKKHIRKELGVD